MSDIKIRLLGQQEYRPTWQAMRQLVDNADDNTVEEIWLLQHPPVFTLGQAGKREHLLRQTDIPVIQSDRGGQITYHGPGQAVAYLMLNLKKRQLGLRRLVRLLEMAIIGLLQEYGINGQGDVAAPGVYVDGKKIAAVGLRVRRGWTYHGISLNIDMDLSPFSNINPCGYRGLQVTDMARLSPPAPITPITQQLGNHLQTALSYPKNPA